MELFKPLFYIVNNKLTQQLEDWSKCWIPNWPICISWPLVCFNDL